MQQIEESRVMYRLTPLSIAEVNKFFLDHNNEASAFNPVEKAFRDYASQFCLLKNRIDQSSVIRGHLKEMSNAYQMELDNRQDLTDRQMNKALKTFRKIQSKAWNLNLTDKQTIIMVCDPKREIPEHHLERLASIIRDEYRD